MKMQTLRMFCLGLILGLDGAARAKTIYVDKHSGSPSAPYTNTTTAAHSIQVAIDVAVVGDEVVLSPDTYTPSAPLVITNAITLRGWTLDLDHADNYVISAEHAHKVLDLGTNDCEVAGLTIGNGSGGGINCGNNTPLVWNCIISGNENGGGMYKGSANNCIFTNNSSYYSGGASSTMATNCLFVGNSATADGGGLLNGSAYDCTFKNNSAKTGGGMKGGTATRCTFINNNASDGGGVYQTTLNQCALSGNSAGNQGGGSGRSTANNCTFTDNSAFNGGGGMYSGTANNSILWNNRSVLKGNNVEGGTQTHYSCYPEARTDDGLLNITNNPQLVSFSHIATGSPCIGAGSTNYLTHAADIDGEGWNPLPVIGCDEIKSTIGGDITPTLSAPEHVVADQEVHFAAYVEGAVTQTILDFGDGTAVTNPVSTEIAHAFSYGNHWVVLTGYNDDYPGGVSVSNIVYARTDTTTTIYVSTDGDDAHDGQSWATAKATIQAGIAAQDYARGLVLVSNGTYSVTAEIFVNKPVRIQGLDGAAHTTVKGNKNKRCFTLYNSYCTLKELTIRDGGGYGSESSGGGAIQCSGLNPVVDSCILTANNTANGGGAMWRGTATNCTFKLNTGGNGPAGMEDGYAIDCLFEQNTSGNGAGGIQNAFATRCIFKENKGTTGGGARDSQVFDCQFLFNESTSSGGGMYRGSAENCVFRGNKSLTAGGGTDGASATHCTYTANQATTSGGGSHSGTLDHCIVWYNTAFGDNDNIAAGTVTYSCSPDLEHGVSGNITNNPQLVSASHISPASPCAGTGTIPRDTFDIDGDNWRSSPAMGCDEPTLPYSAADVSITIEGPTDIPAGYKAFFNVDIQGAFCRDYIEFGDGQTAINSAIGPIYHTWTTPGTYDMVISAYDENNQYLATVTNAITVRADDFNTIYVATNGNDSANGRSWSTAKQTIQAAIDEQDFPGGQVVVSNGVYVLAETVKIHKDIQLYSLNGASNTIIDAGSLPNYQISRGMEIGDNHSTVSGFTIRNANYTWTGGGIWCDNSHSPVISNCILESNHAGSAGGMYAGTAVDCVFTNNEAFSGKGGGLYLGEAQRCRFIGNDARDGGGGMYAGTAYSCSFEKNSSHGHGAGLLEGEANDCTFIENESYYSGAGMADGTATDCIFIKNRADQPGGGMSGGIANRCAFINNRSINASGGGMQSGTANSCYFTGNRAATDGGATSYTTLNNCTVTGNSANGKAGGCYAGNANNSIVWNNTAGESDNDLYSAHPNYTCSPDAPHGTDGCITNNPQLITASHIAATSPCMGAGDSTLAPATDIDGEAWNNPPAMGCDEVGATLTGAIEMSLHGPSPIRSLSWGDYMAVFDGQISKTIIDFGHGTPLTNTVGSIQHFWPGPDGQDYPVVLTAFNDDYPQGTSFTQTVEVVDSAADLYVRYDGNDANDGHSWTNAKQTIQAAIDAQNVYNGKVRVDGDHYTLTQPIIIAKPVQLEGVDSGDGFGGSVAVVDAGSSNRCFDVGAVDCLIANFTLQNGAASTQGYSNNEGGGIRCKTTDPVIRLVTIRDCTAYYGGAVYKGRLESCTLSNNTATSNGGAIYGSDAWGTTITGNSATNYGGGAANALLLSNCTLSSNSAASGGAVYNATLTNCTLVANTAGNSGGGAYDCTLDFCTITSNTASSAGGAYGGTADRCHFTTNNASVTDGGGMYGGTAHNCTFHFNRAERRGGGVYSTTLRNCTVVGNGALDTGGAYSTYIYNSIIWDNFALTNAVNVTSGATPRNSCYPEANPANSYGNITNNPQFVSYAPGFAIRGSDYYLSNFSPCLNAGDNSYVQTDTDFNGWPRILYSTVDMGANEMYFFAADTDGDGMQDGWELEEFGGTTNAVATDDADEDTFNNLGEFIAGTDPHDDTAYLHITQSSVTVDNDGISWIHLEWIPSVEGRIYDVSWSTNLVDGFTDKGYALPYPSDEISFGNDLPESFYKIHVRLDN